MKILWRGFRWFVAANSVAVAWSIAGSSRRLGWPVAGQPCCKEFCGALEAPLSRITVLPIRSMSSRCSCRVVSGGIFHAALTLQLLALPSHQPDSTNNSVPAVSDFEDQNTSLA
ncbi:hypothetical protein IWZ01DRAFT_305783 [Phyllosticta capitalensis]